MLVRVDPSPSSMRPAECRRVRVHLSDNLADYLDITQEDNGNIKLRLGEGSLVIMPSLSNEAIVQRLPYD